MLEMILSNEIKNRSSEFASKILRKSLLAFRVWGQYLVTFIAKQKKALALHRHIRLRQRYIMTRNSRVRLRYVAASLFSFAFCVSYAIGGMLPAENVVFVRDTAVEVVDISSDILGDEKKDKKVEDAVDVELLTQISDGIRMASEAIKKTEVPRFREVEVQSGQTVAGLLQNVGLEGPEAYRAVKALGEHFDVRKVRSGQKIGLHFEPRPDGSMELLKMEMKLNPVKQVSITRNGASDFESALEEKELVPRMYARKARIKSSLYGSAALAGIPQQVIAELIRIYSWDVDFQRDIRQGDGIEILYETFETEDGEFARYGDILYASLSVGGKKIPMYRYEMNDGSVDYFQPNGMSIRKTLMKTPVDGARISSGYGMRMHPILGYNKMHKGMDYAAPTGTPIYAAGDGTVEYAGRKGAYGNYVRIRHNSKLKTAYAHLHRFKKGVTKGTRVEQGEVIGYVGSTGRSTGPHLHYEVLINNKQVNPNSVDVPTGEQLRGKELERFKSIRGAIKQQYASLSDDVELASLEHAPR